MTWGGVDVCVEGGPVKWYMHNSMIMRYQVKTVGCDSRMHDRPPSRYGKYPCDNLGEIWVCHFKKPTTYGQRELGGRHVKSTGRLAVPWNQGGQARLMFKTRRSGGKQKHSDYIGIQTWKVLALVPQPLCLSQSRVCLAIVYIVSQLLLSRAAELFTNKSLHNTWKWKDPPVALPQLHGGLSQVLKSKEMLQSAPGLELA